MVLRPDAEPGSLHLTLTLPPLEARPFAPLDPGYLAALGARARAHATQLVDFLRATREGFATARVADWPSRVGYAKRGVCSDDVVLEREDVLAGRRRADEVALSSWPIELWEDHRRARFEHPAGPCSIPLGALVSRDHPRLGMAGRCLSASHEAHGALRVIGTALATGEAIGVAAAAAAASGVDARRDRPGRGAGTHSRRRREASAVSVLDEIRARARERPDARRWSCAAAAQGERRISYAALVARMEAGAARLAPPASAAQIAAGSRPHRAGLRREALSILAAGACLVPIPTDTAAPRSIASPSRRRSTTWCARPAASRTVRRVPSVPAVDGAGDARLPRARSGLSTLHVRHHERAQGRDPLARPHRGAARGGESGPPHRARRPHPVAAADGASLRGVHPALPAGRRHDPAALGLARAARARARGARARRACSTPRPFTITCSRRTPRGSGCPTCGSRSPPPRGCAPTWRARFHERFGIALAQALGIIEVGLPVVNLDEAKRSPLALGRPLPAYDVWLRGDDGSRLDGPGGPSAPARSASAGPACSTPTSRPGRLRRRSSRRMAFAPATRAGSTPTARCSWRAAARTASTWPA